MPEQKRQWKAHTRTVNGRTVRVKGHTRTGQERWQQAGAAFASGARAVRDNPKARRLATQTAATLAASGMALLILGEAAATLVMTVGLTAITLLNAMNAGLGWLNEQHKQTTKAQRGRRTRASGRASSSRAGSARRTGSSRARTTSSRSSSTRRTAGTKSTSSRTRRR